MLAYWEQRLGGFPPLAVPRGMIAAAGRSPQGRASQPGGAAPPRGRLLLRASCPCDPGATAHTRLQNGKRALSQKPSLSAHAIGQGEGG